MKRKSLGAPLPDDEQSISDRAEISAQDIEDAKSWAAASDEQLGELLSAEPDADD